MSYYKSPEYLQVIKEYFDCKDHHTRGTLLSLNENEQNQVLTKLTSALYGHIIDRVDDIDFGEIPNTKGDFTKIPNFDKITDSLNIMKNLLKEFRQKTDPVDTVLNAINNLVERKDMFTLAYKVNSELPMVMYNMLALSIVSSTSMLIATCVEFVKIPNSEDFEISLNKVAIVKTKENLQFTSLAKFNKLCSTGEFDKAMNHIIKTVGSNMMGAVDTYAVMSVIVIATIALSIIPLMREMIYFFYHTRVRVSDFFDIQADLLQMNVYNLEKNSTVSREEKDKITKKQMKIIELFRKLADKIAISSSTSSNNAVKDITADSKTYTLKGDKNSEDLEVSSGTGSSSSVLF